MTRIKREGLPDLIRWNPGDVPDWETPDIQDSHSTWCGNCGLDVPGCGCPRDVLVAAAAGAPQRQHLERHLATLVAELRVELATLKAVHWVVPAPEPTETDRDRMHSGFRHPGTRGYRGGGQL